MTLRVIGEVAAGYIYDGRGRAGHGGAHHDRRADTAAAPTPSCPSRRRTRPPGRVFGVASPRAATEVGILKARRPGANIRRAGEDVQAAAWCCAPARSCTRRRSACWRRWASARSRVYRRPVVAVLSTGDELLELGAGARAGQDLRRNSYSVCGADHGGRRHPAPPGHRPRHGRRPDASRCTAALDADLIVTTAGVSRGDYDVVKDVLLREGEVGFWTVRMRPGKPLAFGSFRAPDGRRVPHLGLPGNPVSSHGGVRAVRPARPSTRCSGRERLGAPDAARDARRPPRQPGRPPLLRPRHRARSARGATTRR